MAGPVVIKKSNAVASVRRFGQSNRISVGGPGLRGLPGAPGPAVIYYASAVYKSAGVIPSRYMAEPSAPVQSYQNDVFCEITQGSFGAQMEVFLEANGVAIHGPVLVTKGTPYTFNGLGYTASVGARMTWVITKTIGTVTEVFMRTHGTTTLASDQVDRPVLRVNFRKSVMLAPQEYGALGNGSDDTSALVAWAAACQSEKLQPYVPEGRYKCSQILDFSSSGGAIKGAGEGRSIIEFTNAAAGGFKCAPSGGGNPDGTFSIDQLGIQCSANVAKAIDITMPNNGDFTNRYRIGLRNIDIMGVPTTNTYFGVGVFERNVGYSERRRVRYWGSYENATAVSGYYGGVGLDIDTQVVGDTPANGLTLENLFDGITVNFANTGMRIRGFPEGMYIRGSNLAFVANGIDAVAQTGTRQPLLNIIGNHINATTFAIRAQRFNQSMFIANHIARPGGITYGVDWYGIDLVDSILAVVNGNIIVPEGVNLASSGNMYGVRFSGDSWFGAVDGNQFAGGISAAYKAMAAAVRFETAVQGNKIGMTNQYTGQMTAPVSDASGTTTNILTGITVQKGGVTQGPTGGITLINFGTGISVTPSGQQVTVTAP